MGPVAATGLLVDLRSRPQPSASRPDSAPKPAAPGRALVPLAPLAWAERGSECRSMPQRPSAAFLAQLIAANQHLPQTRERRRAEPHEAIAAYRAAARAV